MKDIQPKNQAMKTHFKSAKLLSQRIWRRCYKTLGTSVTMPIEHYFLLELMYFYKIQFILMLAFMYVVILVFISSVFNLKDGFFPEGFYTNFMEVKIYKNKFIFNYRLLVSRSSCILTNFRKFKVALTDKLSTWSVLAVKWKDKQT